MGTGLAGGHSAVARDFETIRSRVRGREDLVDEYRLLTFPTVVGAGDRLFATGMPADFRFTMIDAADLAALTILRRDRGDESR